jgi:hypothetical protein
MISELTLGIQLLNHAAVLMSSSEDSGGGELALLLAGPSAGSALFWAIYRYYRNADKSHDFEHETAVAPTGPISGNDTRVGKVHKVRNREIAGNNVSSYRERVRRY